MALLVAEGFDDLSSNTSVTHFLNKQYNWSGAAITEFSNSGGRAAGRYGGYAKATGSAGVLNVKFSLPSNLAECFMALAVYRNHSGTDGQNIISFRDGETDQVRIRQKAADPSVVEVYRNTTLLGASAAGVLPFGVWKWLSVRIVIHSTAGIVEVRDGLGNVLINLTSQNTQASGNAYIDNVALESTQNASTYWDDVLIMDTTGSTLLGHLTERAIRTVFPTGDGTTLEWTASAGNRWECIDEQTPDDDSTYIASGTPGEINLSAAGNLTGNETGIDGLIVQHRTRKDDIGGRTARGLVRTGGANYAGGTVALDSTYAHFADLWELNPDTSAEWLQTEIDAIEIGAEVVA